MKEWENIQINTVTLNNGEPEKTIAFAFVGDEVATRKWEKQSIYLKAQAKSMYEHQSTPWKQHNASESHTFCWLFYIYFKTIMCRFMIQWELGGGGSEHDTGWAMDV